MEELVDQDVRLDLLQHPAVRVDEADVAAAGDPEVGVARLARAVHGAAEHGDLEVLRVLAQPLLDLVSASCWTPTLSRPQLGQAIITGPRSRRPSALRISQAAFDLLDRVGGQRDADRVADPVGEQRAHADGALDRAGERRARLGDAEVERVRHLPPASIR